MRKYQAFWEALKQHGKVQAEVNQDLQLRVINGVKKEKTGDLAYKLICSESDYQAKLEIHAEGSVLTMTLVNVNYTLYTL